MLNTVVTMKEAIVGFVLFKFVKLMWNNYKQSTVSCMNACMWTLVCLLYVFIDGHLI